ncbi:hypothetical protein RAA17_20490 [Komagataeibacter rhaeticus]|nr:hypothetical protein [Komagataeibacter rhaeticus]
MKPRPAARWACCPSHWRRDREQADVTPQLPAELRNRVDHLSLDGMTGPAGIRLLDERERQRPVGLIANAASDTPLMGSLFYLRRALQPVAELREGIWTRCWPARFRSSSHPMARWAARTAAARWKPGCAPVAR